MHKRVLLIFFSLFSVVIAYGQVNYDSDTLACCDDFPHPAAPEMVFVEGGTFWMGCTNEQTHCREDEYPVHLVTVSSFYIGKYPVTQGQWKSLMFDNPSNFVRGDNYPVENVTWLDVQEFISRLNAVTGRVYRLPREAEWEFAARGGNLNRAYMYSGSHNLSDVAWYWSNSSNSTHPVGLKLPNELGIHDMSGNVSEWCYDVYGPYPSVALRDPTGPAAGSRHVLRGGRWTSSMRSCRISYRENAPAGYRHPDVGFRLVLDVSEEPKKLEELDD